MTKRRAAWAAHEKHYFFGVKSRKQGEYLAASKIASAMLTAPAVPVPAMSNAVPWSTDVLRIGIQCAPGRDRATKHCYISPLHTDGIRNLPPQALPHRIPLPLIP